MNNDPKHPDIETPETPEQRLERKQKADAAAGGDDKRTPQNRTDFEPPKPKAEKPEPKDEPKERPRSHAARRKPEVKYTKVKAKVRKHK